MTHTAQIPTKNQPTHFNGFPNLETVPETLHDLFLFLRKQNNQIQVHYKAIAKTHYITIVFGENFTIGCDKLLKKLPLTQFLLSKLSHKKESSMMILTERIVKTTAA